MIWNFTSYVQANMEMQGSSSVAVCCSPTVWFSLRACSILSNGRLCGPTRFYLWSTLRHVWCERATVWSLKGVPCAPFSVSSLT